MLQKKQQCDTESLVHLVRVSEHLRQSCYRCFPPSSPPIGLSWCSGQTVSRSKAESGCSGHTRDVDGTSRILLLHFIPAARSPHPRNSPPPPMLMGLRRPSQLSETCHSFTSCTPPITHLLNQYLLSTTECQQLLGTGAVTKPNLCLHVEGDRL